MRLFLAIACVLALLPVTTAAQIEIPGFEYDEMRCTFDEIVNLPPQHDLVCRFENLRPAETEPAPSPSPTPTSTPTPPVGPAIRIVPDQYPTIAAALAAIPPGSTVLLRSGTYREMVTISTNGVKLVADAGATPVIDAECSRAHGVKVTGDDVTIRGLTIKRSVEAGVLIGERLAARATIDGNVIQDYNCQDVHDQYAAGVSAWYAGPGHKVINNTIQRRSDPAGPHPGKGNGIWFKSNAVSPSGGGHTISGNIIHGGYDGIGGEEEGSPRGGFDRDTLIERNQIYACGDDGIQVEGGGLSIVVQDNTITNCGLGIAVATPLTGPVTLQRNTITGSTVGLLGAHACYKVGRDSAATIIIRDSVCRLGGTTGDGIKQTNTGSGVLQVSNNVWDVGRYVYEITTAPKTGSTFDGNCMATRDTTRFVKWSSGTYLTLATYRTATGFETNGRTGPC